MAAIGTGGAPTIKRVVILGGGPAGVAAAYWLSAPQQNGAYQVTLYSQGWRLGGKCASGRNAALADRIEEHGLHVLMGCYQNAFATIRNCYLEWRAVKKDPANPFQVWTDAFLPQWLVTLMAEDGPGDPPAWSPWCFPIPPLPGMPGDGPLATMSAATPSAAAVPAGGAALILQMSAWLKAAVPPNAPYAEPLLTALAALDAVLVRPSPIAVPSTMHAALEAAQDAIHAAMTPDLDPDARVSAAAATSQLIDRFSILADLGLAIGWGYLRDIYLKGPGAYDALDTQDFRAWLKSCGAAAATVASAPVRAFYDLAFAGTKTRFLGEHGGSGAAGCTLRAMMEMGLGFRHAPLWKMAAGMGDTVFTPFYDVLVARGVDVQFFSRLTALRPNDNQEVGEIDISVQATMVEGPYRPLVRVNNLDCWPNQPDWSQLVDGAELQREGVNFESSVCTVTSGPPITLLAGADFDLAVVAIPPAALAKIVVPLVATSRAWATALSAAASVATQSLQLWMLPNLNDLGWTAGPTVLTAFAEPYDSWGDMSQVIPRETWIGAGAPRSIGYFCGCLEFPVEIAPGSLPGLAAAAADGWMASNLKTLWPNMVGPPAIVSQVVSRYGVANIDVSELYVRTPAGANVASRFNPGAPAGFGNLYAVGDWTKTRFSGGCLESAIESAMLASRAISGFPPAIKTS